MARFVLVHGGGHGGWCWDALGQRLRAAGHEVHAPTLKGLAERFGELEPGIDLSVHVAEVAGLLASLPGKAVLVGHSYGGMVISGAAAAVPERIARLVYLDAAIPLDGEALLDVSPGLAALAGETREEAGVLLGLWPDARTLAIYGLEGEMAERAMARLTPHPWACFTQPLVLAQPQALAQVPRAILNCTATLAARPAAIRHRWSEGDVVEEIAAPHDLMLTHPDAVAEFLLRLV